jgi:hypothetical protein
MLIREAELSPRVILEALQRAQQLNDQRLCRLLEGLQYRQVIPVSVFDLMSSCLRSDNKYTATILDVLKGRETLPGNLISQTLSLLASDDSEVRIAAGDVLTGHTLPDENLAQIVDLLGSVETRGTASKVLADRPTLSDAILRRIVAHFDNNDVEAGICALHALHAQTAPPDELLSQIIALLDDKNPSFQCRAVNALSIHKRAQTASCIGW